MKVVIDIPEDCLNACKHWVNSKVATWSEAIIANGTPIIKCKDCKYQVKEWQEDKRMKDKGYWVCGCEHFGELMGYWGFGGNDNEFCSDAEQKDKLKEVHND